jgi:Arc/MetJ-type ribon-helix-helix transcriptional regulator
MPKRAVRIQPELDQRMQKATKERGYRSPSAFIRAAIESELKMPSERAGMEEQTAASFDRLAKELRRVRRGQQAIFALLDALTKVFLGCVPEPPADARAQSITLARDRYMRLMKSAGQTLASDTRSAMQDLLGDEDE